MNLINNEIGLGIDIPDLLIEKIYKVGLKHYPNEFGGLLIGYYSKDKKTVVIQETLLPKKYKSSRFSFERNVEELRKKLEKYYSQDPSLIYVGEWHTHPDSLPIPSSTDLNAINDIINCETVLIKNPILMIIGINKEKCDPGFYVYFKNRIYKYEEERRA